jgi:pimeloyl-ACP methyl ester carboxylesterase
VEAAPRSQGLGVRTLSKGETRAMAQIPQAAQEACCRIILVHGTWGWGTLGARNPFTFFVRRRRFGLWRRTKTLWFERGSSFRDKLKYWLSQAAIKHQLGVFLWSGANSVYARDVAATRLARVLKLQAEAFQNDTIVVVGHSHGGNVALRALHYLGTVAERINVVTLATPFLHVYVAKSLFPVVSYIEPYILTLCTFVIAESILYYLSIIDPVSWMVPSVIAFFYPL